jgi:hypothetical protein
VWQRVITEYLIISLGTHKKLLSLMFNAVRAVSRETLAGILSMLLVEISKSVMGHRSPNMFCNQMKEYVQRFYGKRNHV